MEKGLGFTTVVVKGKGPLAADARGPRLKATDSAERHLLARVAAAAAVTREESIFRTIDGVKVGFVGKAEGTCVGG